MRSCEYILVAKQTGSEWYVGGMTNWDAREVEVDFSFLTPGIFYRATILKDGNNAGSYPTRYAADTIVVTHETKLPVSMAKGGGFVIRLIEQTETGINNTRTSASLYVDKAQDTLWVNAREALQSVQIYNSSGQNLFNRLLGKKDLSHKINLSGFDPGIYIAKIQTVSTMDTIKFIY
jgi:alpha-glucosidase